MMTGGKKAESKAGIPAARRGQQMGDETSPPDVKEQAEGRTPALRGRRKEASKFYADDSSQQAGSDAVAPSDNAPSAPAVIPTGVKQGESGGERVFKQRRKAGRAKGSGGGRG